MTPECLHIIEPTLTNETGHCFSFISSLIQASGSTPLVLWCDRSAKMRIPERVRVNPFFVRKLRRLQSFWLYRKLLHAQERIFIPTADRTDIVLLDWAAGGKILPNRVHLFVHWFEPTKRKSAHIANLARHQPDIAILAPTASVCEEFRSAGFRNTRLVPYPITPNRDETGSGAEHEFKHLLFAGAARQDKGFRAVVNLVELLESRMEAIPVILQTSAEHYEKYDKATRDDIRRLEDFRYPYLRLIGKTLSQKSYRELFAGAICLQLYSQKDFRDRISGVTLDALSGGSPVITLSGTWMARVLLQYDAGLVIDGTEPESVYRAVEQVRTRYRHYRDNALKAGRALQIQNSADHLFRELIVQ